MWVELCKLVPKYHHTKTDVPISLQLLFNRTHKGIQNCIVTKIASLLSDIGAIERVKGFLCLWLKFRGEDIRIVFAHT